MRGNTLLGLETAEVGGILVVRVRGELDRLTAPELGRALEDAVSRGRDVVVVLGDVTYLDMGGIKLLEAAARSAGEQGRAFVLAEPAPVVRRILEIVVFDRGVPIVARLSEALDHLHPGLSAVLEESPSDASDAPPSGKNADDD